MYESINREEEIHTELMGNITEASAYYTFHRILSSTSYTLGKAFYIL